MTTGTYFDKKGEINELRTLLRNVANDRDCMKKRDAVKKVIAYMTLGIDVSRLFTDVIMASHANDVVLKKMVYLYLANYAESSPDLTLLCINTLKKDCADDDPSIRGLALRSLCSLRIDSMLEYVEPSAINGLKDPSGYVRKSAIMGILKIFHISPLNIRENDEIIDRLYQLVTDPDPLVSLNSLYVLEEILMDIGGVKVTKPVVEHLLNRISYYNEYGISQVLTLLCKYECEGEEEVFQIMNLLDPLLKMSSSSVVLAVSKVFVRFMERNREQQQMRQAYQSGSSDSTGGIDGLSSQIVARLKGPLLTLLATNSQEITYTVLLHIHLLLSQVLSHGQQNTNNSEGPGGGSGAAANPFHIIPTWVEDYKTFFPKFSDLAYVKKVKLDILTLLVIPETVESIVCEMREAVTDVSAEIARHSIRSIGRIAVQQGESYVSYILGSLVELFQFDTSYVTSESVIVLRDLLRKYPDQFPVVSGALQAIMSGRPIVIESESGERSSSMSYGPARCGISLQSDECDAQCKAALIFLCGEFGEQIGDAVYLLEPLIAEVDPISGEYDKHLKDNQNQDNEYDEDGYTIGNNQKVDAVYAPHPSIVKNELLVAVIKLFFIRPGECQKLLGCLLKKAIQDSAEQFTSGLDLDPRDRALLYYRLLRQCSNTDDVKRIICKDANTSSKSTLFVEDQYGDDVSAKIYREFNSLSVIYGEHSSKFTKSRSESLLYKGSHIPSGPNIPVDTVTSGPVSAPVGPTQDVINSSDPSSALVDDLLGGNTVTQIQSSNNNIRGSTVTQGTSGSNDDHFDLLGGNDDHITTVPTATAVSVVNSTGNNNDDFDLLGGGDTPAAAAVTVPVTSSLDDLLGTGPSGPPLTSNQVQQVQPQSEFDDLLGSGSGNTNTTVTLSTAVLDPSLYQELWEKIDNNNISTGTVLTQTSNNVKLTADSDLSSLDGEIQAVLKFNNFSCIASGLTEENVLKFYLYTAISSTSSNNFVLFEVLLAIGKLDVTVKSKKGNSEVSQVLDKFWTAMSKYVEKGK